MRSFFTQPDFYHFKSLQNAFFHFLPVFKKFKKCNKSGKLVFISENNKKIMCCECDECFSLKRAAGRDTPSFLVRFLRLPTKNLVDCSSRENFFCRFLFSRKKAVEIWRQAAACTAHSSISHRDTTSTNAPAPPKSLDSVYFKCTSSNFPIIALQRKLHSEKKKLQWHSKTQIELLTICGRILKLP